MTKRLILAFLATLVLVPAAAQYQEVRGMYVGTTVYKGDTIPVLEMMPVYIFRSKADLRQYQRLIYNLKKVYPIARHANELLRQTEEKMVGLKNDRQRRAYIKELEDQLKKEYTPVLKQMSMSQGKLLLKLIDRQTTHTSYELVKDLRGSFSAFFWQGIARIFGANLKESYDAQGEDRLIEQLIYYYEIGLL